MKNKVTFNTGFQRQQKDNLAKVLGLIPAEIRGMDGSLPDIRVISKRRPKGSYNVVIDTTEGWRLDKMPYLGDCPAELLSYSSSSVFIYIDVKTEKMRSHYSFKIHDGRDVERVGRRDYKIRE